MNIKIEQDLDAGNPRTEWDNVSQLVVWSKYAFAEDNTDYNGEPEDFAAWAKVNCVVWLPVYLYDHGGISISTSSFNDQWDSGQVGYVFITRETALKEWGFKRMNAKRLKQLESHLQGDIEMLDQYLTGDMWGYVIEDESGDTVDSCWGFYGRAYCEEEAARVLADIIATSAHKTSDQSRYLAAIC